MMAVEKGMMGVVRKYLDEEEDGSSDVSDVNNKGEGLLHMAVRKGNVEMFELLLMYGCVDVNERTRDRRKRKSVMEMIEETGDEVLKYPMMDVVESLS